MLHDHLQLLQQSKCCKTKSEFSTVFELPSGYRTRVREMNNRDYLTICKYCENQDFGGFITIIEYLIPEFNDLNIVDKAYALILYRSLFLGPEIQVMNDEKSPVTIDLNTVLENIAEVECKQWELEHEGFKIILGPLKSFVSSGDIYDCIKTIEYNNKTVKGNEINEVLEFLPVEVYTFINQKILDFYRYYNMVEIISEAPKAKLRALQLNLNDNSFCEFILSLYKTDLDSLFHEIYIFAQHFKNIDYFKLAPLDSKILVSILHKETSEAKKAQEQSNDYQNPLTPQL